MQTRRSHEPADSPVPGVALDAEQERRLESTPPVLEPDGDREARRAARDERRGTAEERPGVMIPSRRKRLPLEGPLMRLIASGGIVAIGVVIAAIMTSQDSAGWLIGLIVSGVSLLLAAVLWSSRRV